MKNILMNMLVGGLVLVAAAGCRKEDDIPSGEMALTAPVMTEVAAPGAVATSGVVVDRNALDLGVIRVISWGFCYGTEANPTIHNATVTTTPVEETITAPLTGLVNNTKYYVRAFATLYPDGVIYSPATEMALGTPQR